MGTRPPASALTIEEVSAELGVTRTVVLALIRSGELPAVRAWTQAGRPWLIERLALDEWLRVQQTATRRYVEDNPRGGEGMWDQGTGGSHR